jgi:SAM-dependent methyltransferase
MRDQEELARIRAVYAERDQRPRRHPAVVAAYRMVNEDRMLRIHDLVDDVMPDQAPRILDVGCGGGYDLGVWRSFGWPPAKLAGVDLVPSRVAAARAANPGVDIRIGQGSTIPFGDQAFDVVTAVTVFSSILDPGLRRAVFGEMARVVRSGGLIVIHDFVVRNPRNHDVTAMPLEVLEGLGGPPTGSLRITPLLHAVALGAWVHPRIAGVAMRLAPRTHRLTWWVR